FADPLQILKVAFSMGGNEVQAQYFTLHGPIHSPLDAVESSCTLGRERAPKHNVSTSMLDGGDGLPILLRIIQVFIGKLQTALYMCFLEQGDLASAAVLQTITAWCVANGFLGDCGPSCLEIIHQLPMCSSGVILLLGHITGHWEPEFLLFAWGLKYLFSASNTNKVI